MVSFVRPRTASRRSPPIKQARSLSPRSVVVECGIQIDGEARDLEHLQQPLQVNLNYDSYFRDDSSSSATEESSARRPLTPSGPGNIPRNLKRKLFSTDLPARSVMNLRHRQVSNETMEWLSSYSCDVSNATSAHAVSDIEENDEPLTPKALQNDSSVAQMDETNDAPMRTLTEPVEELWLGPVFDSSETVLTAISSLPSSVTHLDLDLRNALHLLPQAMPLLFGRHHLRTLSLHLFGDAGAIELAKWMNHNPNLECLDLRGNRIGSTGARTIVDAIMAGAHNNSDRFPSRQNLKRLNLNCNCILHGDKIGELLAANTSLEALDLGLNWLGNEEIEEICAGLCKNATLRELNLHGCHRISHKGLKTILRCLQLHNTSLLKIGLQAFDEEGQRLIEEINYWLKLNKGGRSLIQLSLPPSSASSEQGTQSIGHHPRKSGRRDSTTLGIWPHALAKSSTEPDCLFHLLREGFGARILNR